MRPVLIILGIAAAVVATIFFLKRRREARRRWLMALPFPLAWRAALRRNVGLYARLPRALRVRLHGLVHVFLDGKNFEGCGGQELTDEIRLTVAAQACMLIVNRPGRVYPRLSSILIYPEAYVVGRRPSSGGLTVDEDTVLAGESWTNTAVVLAWDSVHHGAKHPHDGHNVVLHEFAHQLDQEDGRADGVPILEDASKYADWQRVLADAFRRLKEDIEHYRSHLLNDYAAVNPAEFFAVATETFFEAPEAMKESEPELYEELQDYYRLDPAAWEGISTT